eukprot:TRINITY_DN3139_c0_g1_i1.p1 TRINITY_DN3139_c0_g1~~TRINITY_DN3139_c0_g1_i1.p1  ORF type:complete len:239 (-),score=58.11 TRINITY_DN3139_c0_g1_i1:379-1095(-)
MHILSILVLIVGASAKQNFRWENNTIPYCFDESVSTDDKDLIKSQMVLIEENTCLKFSERTQDDVPKHHLRIIVNKAQCNDVEGKMKTKGRVDFPEGGNDGAVLFKITLTDGECGDNDDMVRGAILHILFLAFGATHTHIRPDRDDYIQINNNCIIEKYLDMFEANDNAEMAMSVPYTCDSLMHYRNDSGTVCAEADARCARLCPTIVAKPGNTDCDQIGSYVANSADWMMLNKYHCL